MPFGNRYVKILFSHFQTTYITFKIKQEIAREAEKPDILHENSPGARDYQNLPFFLAPSCSLHRNHELRRKRIPLKPAHARNNAGYNLHRF